MKRSTRKNRKKPIRWFDDPKTQEKKVQEKPERIDEFWKGSSKRVKNYLLPSIFLAYLADYDYPPRRS